MKLTCDCGMGGPPMHTKITSHRDTLTMDLALQNHVALIIGSASGIGRATAEAFAAEGAHVALWDLSTEAESIARELSTKHHIRAHAFRVDVADESSVQSA